MNSLGSREFKTTYLRFWLSSKSFVCVYVRALDVEGETREFEKGLRKKGNQKNKI